MQLCILLRGCGVHDEGEGSIRPASSLPRVGLVRWTAPPFCCVTTAPAAPGGWKGLAPAQTPRQVGATPASCHEAVQLVLSFASSRRSAALSRPDRLLSLELHWSSAMSPAWRTASPALHAVSDHHRGLRHNRALSVLRGPAPLGSSSALSPMNPSFSASFATSRRDFWFFADSRPPSSRPSSHPIRAHTRCHSPGLQGRVGSCG